jgi:hypothetical protein
VDYTCCGTHILFYGFVINFLEDPPLLGVGDYSNSSLLTALSKSSLVL